jgi:parallel beta-helix repeat protein
MMPRKFVIVFICAIVLIAETVVTSLHAAVIHVPDNYKTIQEAVEKALPKDTIIVKEGAYRENIVIAKPLIIKSSKGPDATSVQADNSDKPVFKLNNVNEAAIIGFKITGSAASGIHLISSQYNEINSNKISGNEIGIFLHSSNNNTLTNNQADSNEQIGIYLELSDNNILKENSADKNNDKGIFLSSSNSNSLIKNSVYLNTWNGITLWSSQNNMLQDNNVFRNTYGIVISDSEENALIDNTIWSNIYIILPAILVYMGIIFFFIQKRIFSFIYSEK